MSPLLFIHWSWISSTSTRKNLDMSDEMRSSIRQTFKQLIADAYMTFHGTRGASRGKNIIISLKEFMSMFHKRESMRRFLTASRMTKYFMQASYNITGQKNGANILDYVRTIDITHNASPEQLERYAALYNFRLRSDTNGERPFQKPPRLSSNNRGYCQHEQRSRSDSRIKKTTQLPRGSGLREARLAYMALTQLEMVLRGEPHLSIKFHTMASPKINRRACIGKPRSFHSWWSVESKMVDHVLVAEIQMDMEWRSLRIFFDSGFRTHVVGNFCACDGVCTHTPSRTHIFFFTFSLRDVQTQTRMAQSVRSAHVISLHLALSILLFHPPFFLLFPHGHFDTTFPSAQSSSSFTRPRSAGQAHLRTCAGEFSYLATPTHLTVYTVFETSVSHVSHGNFALQRGSQESMPRETVARPWERGEREASVISCYSVDVKEKSTEQH